VWLFYCSLLIFFSLNFPANSQPKRKKPIAKQKQPIINIKTDGFFGSFSGLVMIRS
jgi:hypothetical protein